LVSNDNNCNAVMHQKPLLDLSASVLHKFTVELSWTESSLQL